jgi:hypothetical protein
MPEEKKRTRTRRKERKSIPVGRAFIQSTFNNTIVTLTDLDSRVPVRERHTLPRWRPATRLAKPWSTDCAR